jgi:hypothetical protein
LTTCSKPRTRVETNGCWKAVPDLVDQLIPSQRDSMRRSFHSQAAHTDGFDVFKPDPLFYTKKQGRWRWFLCFFHKKYPHPDFFLVGVHSKNTSAGRFSSWIRIHPLWRPLLAPRNNDNILELRWNPEGSLMLVQKLRFFLGGNYAMNPNK